MKPLYASTSVAMRRANNRQWTLKPQDLAMALKLSCIRYEPWSYAELARKVKLSPFEAHAAVQRLFASKLAFELEEGIRVNMTNLRAFVLNGAAFAFPVVHGELTIGFPTAHAAPPLKDLVLAPHDSIVVWPHPEGIERGEGLLPLYDQLPLAALQDAKFYELLALFDALRSGQAREREIARRMLEERLQ